MADVSSFARPRSGDRIAHRYELLEQIGSGGFASVWEATDTRQNQTVAVKVADDSTHDADEVRSRFRREIVALETVEGVGGHPNIVSFSEGEYDAEPPFVCVEFLGQESLDSLVDASMAGLDQLNAIGRDLCAGVSFLHDQGVSHLDIKPSNVLFRGTTPVIIDFNTASLSRRGDPTIFHEDPYKPPEQTPGTGSEIKAGPEADVFSCAAILLYLLTGEEIAPQSLDDEGVDARQLTHDCPELLAATFERATDGNPKNRYRDGGGLKRALEGHQTPGASARLEDARNGQTFTVTDGDTLGRDGTDERPVIAIHDPDRFVSPIHAEFRREANGWYVRDRSLNGTHIRTDGHWVELLSFDGARERLDKGESIDLLDLQQVHPVSDGDLIAPVDRSYGKELRFEEP